MLSIMMLARLDFHHRAINPLFTLADKVLKTTVEIYKPYEGPIQASPLVNEGDARQRTDLGIDAASWAKRHSLAKLYERLSLATGWYTKGNR